MSHWCQSTVQVSYLGSSSSGAVSHFTVQSSTVLAQQGFSISDIEKQVGLRDKWME
jgi:hypothetical protein